MAAEDTTGLNWGTADLEREWVKKERLGPGMVVYESLNEIREDGEILEDDDGAGTGARQEVAVEDVSYVASGSGSGASFAEPVTPTAAAATATATRIVVSEKRGAEPVVKATTTATAAVHAPAAAEIDPATQFLEEEIRAEQVKKNLTAAAMPTSRVSRLLHYGGMKLFYPIGYFWEQNRCMSV